MLMVQAICLKDPRIDVSRNLTYTSYVDSTQTLSEIFPNESVSANVPI